MPTSAPPSKLLRAWVFASLSTLGVLGLMVHLPGSSSADRPETYIHTLAGGGDAPGEDGGDALAARLNRPEGLAAADDGTVYIADSLHHRVWMVAPDGTMTRLAGTGEPGFSGDGGPARDARLHTPEGLALAPDGRLFIGDTVNRRVRQVDPDGTITTVAGTGDRGHDGDGGPARDARLGDPNDLAVAPDGTLYIVDEQFGEVRRLTPDGSLDTLPLNLNPFGVAVAPDGALYVSGGVDHRVWRVEATASDSGTPTAVPVAGTGEPGFSGDGGPAADARLNRPEGLAVGSDGSLYIADRNNHRVRRVDSDGAISTVAASGEPGFSGDGGPAHAARLNQPLRVAAGRGDALLINDLVNQRVRVVTGASSWPPTTTTTTTTTTPSTTAVPPSTSSSTTSTSTTTTSTTTTSTTSTSTTTTVPEPTTTTTTTVPPPTTSTTTTSTTTTPTTTTSSTTSTTSTTTSTTTTSTTAPSGQTGTTTTTTPPPTTGPVAPGPSVPTGPTPGTTSTTVPLGSEGDRQSGDGSGSLPGSSAEVVERGPIGRAGDSTTDAREDEDEGLPRRPPRDVDTDQPDGRSASGDAGSADSPVDGSDIDGDRETSAGSPGEDAAAGPSRPGSDSDGSTWGPVPLSRTGLLAVAALGFLTASVTLVVALFVRYRDI